MRIGHARAGCLLGMVNGAVGIDADLLDGPHVAAFCDDGVGGELAHTELRARGLGADRSVLVARQNRAAILLSPVRGADWDKLRLGPRTNSESSCRTSKGICSSVQLFALRK